MLEKITTKIATVNEWVKAITAWFTLVHGWIRPLRREFWQLVPNWKDAHRFMSTQALGLGTIALTVAIALDAPRTVLIAGLALTALLTLAGSLIEQPEVEADGEE